MQRTPSPTLIEATQKLERYCAYEEGCLLEGGQRRTGLGMSPEAVDQIIGHLIQENDLNEERCGRGYARGKFNIKKWGRNRIVRELKRRQISVYNIKAALQEIDPGDYQETLDALALKRLAQIREANPQKRRKKLA